jgi:hypothetical protein
MVKMASSKRSVKSNPPLQEPATMAPKESSMAIEHGLSGPDMTEASTVQQQAKIDTTVVVVVERDGRESEEVATVKVRPTTAAMGREICWPARTTGSITQNATGKNRTKTKDAEGKVGQVGEV